MKDFTITSDHVLVGYQGAGGSVRIPDGVTTISSAAFSGKTEHTITQVIFPESVHTIGFRTFENFGQLTHVRLPAGLETIAHSTFAKCSRLEQVNWPERLQVIDNNAFDSCQKLDSLVFPAGLKRIGNRGFARCTSLTELTMNEELETLGDAAFSGCSSLKSVTLSPKLKVLPTWAFMDCADLEQIDLPQGLEVIQGGVFSGCGNLSRICIPDGVTSIGSRAFHFCVSLPGALILPRSLTSIGAEAFSKCPVQSISVGMDAFGAISCRSFPGANAGIAVHSGDQWQFYGFSAKANADNLTDFVRRGKWNAYDLELINNGPVYKYKAPARLLGALGRIADPVELTDECRELHLEMLIKNAKKLIPIAEELRCPAIVQTMMQHGIINDKNIKAIAKLLSASAVPEIARIIL